MKMNGKSLFFSIIFLFSIAMDASALVIRHMYEVSLPVASQQKQVRVAAFEQGLIEVSMRVSGSSLAPTRLDLSQAPRMISQYRYYSLSAAEIEAYRKQSAPPMVVPKYKLWMQFDDGKVKQQLRDSGLPIWGYQRPKVLVWLAVKDGRNRYLLKQADHSLIKDAVEKEAHRRGLPLVWPAYDAQDQKELSFIDVWGQFWEPVKQASKRYSVDAILLGRMNWINGSWQVDWSLSLEDKIENWKLSALDMGLITSSGIGVATDQISSRFAVYADSGNDAELLVRISDLDSVKKYAAASHYLASLAPVKNVYATEVSPDRIDFHIELSGDREDLKRIIALGRVLRPDTRTPAEADPVRPEKPRAESLIQADRAADSSPPAGTMTPLIQPPQRPQPHILRYRMNG